MFYIAKIFQAIGVADVGYSVYVGIMLRATMAEEIVLALIGIDPAVKRAAAACKELGRQYPSSTPEDADCAKKATDKAMVKVNELIAASQKGK